MPIDMQALVAPIPGDDPSGEDASFSELFDRIREARRADDPTLSRGDWETDLKAADWRLAMDLSMQALQTLSKDLQAAAWLGEALIAREGLAGARDGFDLITALVDTYWDSLWPRADDGDLEERAGKLAWFNTYAGQALHEVTLTSDGGAPLGLAAFKQSREVDNLARQNAEAHRAALDEGKISGEAFDARLAASPDEALRGLCEMAEQAQAAFSRMKSVLDGRFGRDGASLSAIDEALRGISQVVVKAARAKGLLSDDAMTGDSADAPDAQGGAGIATSPSGTQVDPYGNPAASKDAALRTLVELSAFFKRTEPHSPVGFLLDRAVGWANLPLDQWLSEVVSDDSVLNTVRDRSGMPRA